MPAARERNRGAEGLRRGWSKSGTLVGNDDATQLITIQQVFPEASDYVVQFGVIPQVPAGTLPSIRPQATIIWTVEGNLIVRKVDVGNGVSVQGCAGAVKVSVFDSTANPSTPPIQYDVNILVAPGSRASNTQMPLLYQGEFLIGPGGLQTINVPQNVGIIAVEVDVIDVTTPSHSPIELVVSELSGTPPGQIFYSPVLRPGFVPVGANVNQISLVNNHGADSFRVSVVWGVDG